MAEEKNNKKKPQFGRLQKKIFLLSLISLLFTMGLGIALALVHFNILSDTVSEINDRQKESIGSYVGDLMREAANETLLEQTNDIASMAEAYFNDCVTYVGLLRDRAAEVYAYHLTAPEEVWAQEPDKSNDGTVITQRIYSDTVTDFKDPKLLEDIAMLSAMRGIMENIYTRANTVVSKKYTAAIGSAFVCAPSGVLLIADDHSSNKFAEDGSVKRIPLEEKDWYKTTIEKGGFQFSDLTYDTFTGKMEIIVTLPVYVPGDGEIKAIVGVDLFFDSIEDYFETKTDYDMMMCLLNYDGNVAFSTEKDGIFAAGQDTDLRTMTDNPELANVIRQSYQGEVSPTEITIDGEKWIFSSHLVENMGWPVLAAVAESVLSEPGDALVSELDRINDSETENFNSTHSTLFIWTVIAIGAIIVAALIGAVLMGVKIVRPLRSMTNRVRSLGGTDLVFTMYDELRTHDEIEELAEAFADLSKRTMLYIEENNRITAENERIETELSLAGNIQNSMLPSIFPAFPDRKEFDIYASMDPAKEVGGDFYDFFFIDRDRLALVIADVSGKGVPAALFMMMSKMLINNYTMLMDDSPARILEMVNDQICKNNKAMMFVTVWLGILDIPTGVVTCANAGHEFPAVRKNGRYELLHDKHGFVVGGRKGMKHTEYEIRLEPGDALFVYTDGVPEATDASDELYGPDRMTEALNAHADLSPEELLPRMKEEVDAFVKEAPQFDDLTMLCLQYNGPQG